MNSIASLHRGIVQKPLIPAVAFRHPHQLPFSNFSSIRVPKKAASHSHGNHRPSAAQTWNRNKIYCTYGNQRGSRQSSGGGIVPNGKLALQTLLNFVVETSGGVEKYMEEIQKKKKQALKQVIDKNPRGAEKTMRDQYQKSKGLTPVQIEFDATLALVEILIHVGTAEKCIDGLNLLNEAEMLSKTGPSDAKLSLYRAVLFTLLGDNKMAVTYWTKYAASLGGPSPSP